MWRLNLVLMFAICASFWTIFPLTSSLTALVLTENSSWTAREDAYRRQLLTCKPELRECFEKKLGRSSRRHARVLDENDVGKCLDNLEPVFDKLEERIQKTAKENGSGQETWLFGPEFTAADITLAVLMIRLATIGVSRRYFSIEKRKGVFDYYIRMNKKQPL
ncbi:ganglioside-induced differentiation-associated protein 1-like [Mya arenaria]|uniref:ganglioside-induced differentiation-associated protein 1-like n=1 Tax=Mya arenaria TaxID=6604 RepID=UPI0022E00312|nr:ganglioside-induced differentiation-associated protein 1-like [Mya arenaria]